MVFAMGISVFASGSSSKKPETDAKSSKTSKIATTTLPADKTTATKTEQKPIPCNFVDENHDGICDNRGTENCTHTEMRECSFADKDHDGICDNRGTANCAHTNCDNYTDKNADGICDNCSKTEHHKNIVQNQNGKNHENHNNENHNTENHNTGNHKNRHHGE